MQLPFAASVLLIITLILDIIYGANMPPSAQGSQKSKLVAFSSCIIVYV